MLSYAVLAWFEGAKGGIRVNGQEFSQAPPNEAGFMGQVSRDG
jgi:hypothetical protein